MRTTILFGGTSRERLVAVATAQAISAAMPEAELWFWDVDDSVWTVSASALQAHASQFVRGSDTAKTIRARGVAPLRR